MFPTVEFEFGRYIFSIIFENSYKNFRYTLTLGNICRYREFIDENNFMHIFRGANKPSLTNYFNINLQNPNNHLLYCLHGDCELLIDELNSTSKIRQQPYNYTTSNIKQYEIDDDPIAYLRHKLKDWLK